MGLQDSLRARAAQGALIRHPQRRRLRGMGSAPRPLPAGALRPDSLWPVKALLKRAVPRAARPRRPRAACRSPGIVSRLAVQKGIELMFEALPRVLRARAARAASRSAAASRGTRSSSPSLAQRVSRARAASTSGYDDELAHWIEAASDMFLMPSRYEPCGLNQMYSLRYGTVPIVRRTGGLADSVEHYDPARGTGTGVVFNDFDPAGARVGAQHRARPGTRSRRDWTRMVQNGMQQDFSWQRQGGAVPRALPARSLLQAERAALRRTESSAAGPCDSDILPDEPVGDRSARRPGRAPAACMSVPARLVVTFMSNSVSPSAGTTKLARTRRWQTAGPSTSRV